MTSGTTTWKIPIGGKSQKKLIKELSEGNFCIDSYAENMTPIKSSIPLKKPTEITFVKKSPRDIGFIGGTLNEMLLFLEKHPIFKSCQSQDECYLRIEYINQPKNELVMVAMNPIINTKGNHSTANEPHIFFLEHLGPLWLRARMFRLEHEIDIHSLWFFRSVN